MGNKGAIMQAQIKIGTSMNLDDALKSYGDFRKQIEGTTITYQIAGDKKQLEKIIADVKNADPNIDLHFNISQKEYQKKLKEFESLAGKTGKQISKSLNQSFVDSGKSQKLLKDILGVDFKGTKEEIEKGKSQIITSFKELNKSIETVDVSKLMNLKDADKAMLELQKMLSLLHTLEKTGETKITLGRGRNNFVDITSEIQRLENISLEIGNKISENLTNWIPEYKTQANQEIKNIKAWASKIGIEIREPLKEGFSGDFSKAIKEEIKEAEKSVEDLKKDLDSLNKKLNEFQDKKNKVSSSSLNDKEKETLYDELSEAHRNYTKNDNAKEFVAAIKSYVSKGGSTKNFTTKAGNFNVQRILDEYNDLNGWEKSFVPLDKLQSDVSNMKEIETEIIKIKENIEKKTKELNDAELNLKTLKEKESTNNNDNTGAKSKRDDSSDNGGYPVIVEPELSPDFKEDLQKKISALDPVDVNVIGKLDNDFKKSLQDDISKLDFDININASAVKNSKNITEKSKENNTLDDNLNDKINRYTYHWGDLNNGSKSHKFGSEITAWFSGIKNGGRGWADGTGTYTTSDSGAFDKGDFSDDFKQFHAIDTSKLKMYEAHIEEEAKSFFEFQHKLEQYVLALGSGFTGFDENIEEVTPENLYQEAKDVFKNYSKIFNEVYGDFEKFDAFINEMINLVSVSGLKEDGSFNASKLYQFKKQYGEDDVKTRFLKSLDFQGTDLSGTTYDSIQSGSVIFDINKNDIIAKAKTMQDILKTLGDVAIQTQKDIAKVGSVDDASKSTAQTKNNIDNNANVGTTGMSSEALQAETLEQKISEVTTAVDNKTNAFRQEEQVVVGTVQREISMLEALDGELTVILQTIQEIIKKPLKINVDHSSIEQLSQVDDNGSNVIDQLKKSIDGLQTGILKDLGDSFKNIKLNENTANGIKELANSLNILKETLSGITPEGSGFLNTIKELSSQASGLKDLATVIRASKEEIQKAKGKIAEGATKADNPKDAFKQHGFTTTASDKNFSKDEIEDREIKITGKTEELKRTIEEANGVVKSITSFYDSEDNLIKTQIKAQEKIDGVLRNTTYTTGYSREKKDQEGAVIKEAEAFASSISNDEYSKGIDEQVKSYYSQIIDKLKQINQLKKDLPNMGANESRVAQVQIKRLQEQVRYRKQILDTYDSSTLEKYKKKEEEILRLTGKDQAGKYSNERKNASEQDRIAKQQIEYYKEQEKRAQATKYAGKESQYEEQLKNLLSTNNVTRGNAAFKDVKVDSSGKTVITFLELVNDKARETKITLKDVASVIDKVQNKKFDPNTYSAKTSGWRNATKAEKGDSNNIAGITNAYKKLISTEEEFQKLLAKRKAHTITSEQKDELVKLTNERARAREVLSKIPEGQNLNNDELARQQEYLLVQSQVNEKKQSFMDNEKTIHSLLEKTNTLMSQFKNSNIQGFDQVFERAKNQVSDLNRNLLENKISNIQTGYEDKVSKIVSSLKNVVAVSTPNNIQEANEEMTKLAVKLNRGNVSVENFTNNNKTLTASFQTQKGIIKKVAFEYDELSGAIRMVDKGTKKVKTASEKFLEGFKQKATSLVQYLLTFVSFYEVWNIVKQGITVIKDLDTALTEMRKVSDESIGSLKKFQETSFDMAANVGTTAKQLQNSTADWMRLGESLDEASKSAETANILLNVSEFEDIDSATESLVSMSAAYNELEKIDIVDKLNIIG